MSEEETRTTRHGPGSNLFDIPLRSFSVLTLSHPLRVTAKSRILEPRLEKGNEYFELLSLYFVWIIILFDLEIDVTPVRVDVSLDLV